MNADYPNTPELYCFICKKQYKTELGYYKHSISRKHKQERRYALDFLRNTDIVFLKELQDMRFNQYICHRLDIKNREY